jgi:uncharacterized repeat protein (TIGR01451 family)
VVVADNLSPNCSRTIGAMAIGATVSYTCTRSDVTAAFTNVAVVTARTPTGGSLSARATAPVKVTAPFKPPAPTPVKVVTHPSISIVKDPKSQTVAHGGTATFTITVTNTGDVKLTNVKVADPRSPDCKRDLDTLAAGALQTYTCTRKNVTKGFDNVAIATGKAPNGTKVTARDHAPVKAAPFKPPVKPKPKPKVVSHQKPKATG